jgi:hypothetical protein
MLRPDFLSRSKARAEIDHRAREARLWLEHLERLWVVRVQPTSRPKRVFDRRGLRFFSGGCVKNRSTKMAPPSPCSGQTRPLPTEICVAVNRLTATGGISRPRSPA